MSDKQIQKEAPTTDERINTRVELDFDQRSRAVKLEDDVASDEYATAAEIIYLRDINAALLAQSAGLPGTREPAVIEPKGNTGESPASLPEKASGEPTDIDLIEAVADLHHKLECDSVELDAEAKRVLYSNISRLTRR